MSHFYALDLWCPILSAKIGVKCKNFDVKKCKNFDVKKCKNFDVKIQKFWYKNPKILV